VQRTEGDSMFSSKKKKGGGVESLSLSKNFITFLR
jgi:hypothetical protein